MSRFIVAVTGGIGSGKSTVAEALAGRGAAVVDTDHVAHALTAAGGAALPAIRQAFGDGVLTADGALDRAAMRRQVFADPTARRRLEAILHPLIREESARRCQAAAAPYVLLLIPLLAETRQASPYAFLDRVLVVDCEESTQIARVMRRSHLAEPEVRAIIASQADRATRRAMADDIVVNDGVLDDLAPQLDELHRQYLAQASAKLKASC